MPLSFEQVVFDCRNAATLAEFWSAVLEQPVDPGGSEFFATVGRTGTYPLPTAFMFIQVPEARTGKNRLHVDLGSLTPEVDIARAVANGAERVADFDEYGTVWTTLRDPEGNLFDIAQRHG
jgi:hypothetical protein